MDPDETWITAQGQVSLIDPVLAAQYPGDFTWEEALFTATGLVGISAFPTLAEYGIGQMAWPALMKAGGTIASWLCRDGNCGNEAASIWTRISANRPLYPNTDIPRSFTLSTPNGSYYATESATKHMQEYLSTHLNASQVVLEPTFRSEKVRKKQF